MRLKKRINAGRGSKPGWRRGRWQQACVVIWMAAGLMAMGAVGVEAVVERELWALAPLKRPPIPEVRESRWPRGAIDRFALARLERAGLTAAESADKHTLIRRLTLDLHGINPTPDEVQSFLNDQSELAYDQLIERLLASPRYGERWGRHWLDVARYTESQGFEYDRLRPAAWHFRDYVIDSFNQDKPFDLFMREQIAGDALEPWSPENIIATSLLVCGPWDQAGNGQANATQKAITREEELEDLISVVSQGFLGLTVNCARCHDHKFDPILQEDYYRIKSVFEGVRHGDYPLASAKERAVHDARTTPLKARIAELEQALKKDTDNAQLKEQLERARKDLKSVPPLPVTYAGTRVQPPVTRRLNRGDVQSPAEEMKPGGLAALKIVPHDFHLPADAPEAERRRRFADWIADRRNPLPARVMANRVWHYHFGQGLVATPSDFGNTGNGPSHPELLDWLAVELIDSGWSIKHLHRLITQSSAYRQGSSYQTEAAAQDAENRLLWRFAPRRMEAEVVRDAMLAASGDMNWAMGGPGFRPFDIIEFNSSTYVPADKLGPEFNRRTVYRANVNSGKDPLLDVLDCPDPSVKTPRRNTTTTPLQALSLMNNSFVQRQAGRLASRIQGEGLPPDQWRAAVHRAYEYVLARPPTASELDRGLGVVKERGLANLCWALFNSTEFVYIR